MPSSSACVSRHPRTAKSAENVSRRSDGRERARAIHGNALPWSRYNTVASRDQTNLKGMGTHMRESSVRAHTSDSIIWRVVFVVHAAICQHKYVVYVYDRGAAAYTRDGVVCMRYVFGAVLHLTSFHPPSRARGERAPFLLGACWFGIWSPHRRRPSIYVNGKRLYINRSGLPYARTLGLRSLLRWLDFFSTLAHDWLPEKRGEFYRNVLVWECVCMLVTSRHSQAHAYTYDIQTSAHPNSHARARLDVL